MTPINIALIQKLHLTLIFYPTKQKPQLCLLKAKMDGLNSWNLVWRLLDWNKNLQQHPSFMNKVKHPQVSNFCLKLVNNNNNKNRAWSRETTEFSRVPREVEQFFLLYIKDIFLKGQHFAFFLHLLQMFILIPLFFPLIVCVTKPVHVWHPWWDT